MAEMGDAALAPGATASRLAERRPCPAMRSAAPPAPPGDAPPAGTPAWMPETASGGHRPPLVTDPEIPRSARSVRRRRLPPAGRRRRRDRRRRVGRDGLGAQHDLDGV